MEFLKLMAFSLLFNFQVYVINPKRDSYGLGFDPFKHAPEFRGM